VVQGYKCTEIVKGYTGTGVVHVVQGYRTSTEIQEYCNGTGVVQKHRSTLAPKGYKCSTVEQV
jgi:hypothetical protein